MLSIILFIACALALAGSVFYAAVSKEKKKVANLLSVLSVVILSLNLIIVPLSVHTINAGEVAVVKRLGKPVTVRMPGTYFDFWMFKQYQKYDTKVQKVDIDTMTYSSDAQTMDVQLTLQYQLAAGKAMETTQKYGSLYALQERIVSVATEKVKAVLSAHKAMDIIADRAAMSPAVEKAIKEAIGEEYFVNVTTVVLTNIDFSDAFETAVEEKMIAEQKQLKAEYENKTKIIQAEANAQAKLISAEAEAKANELLERSLTDKVLKKQYIDKWNGTLPNTVAGDSSTIMIPAQ